LKPCVVGYEVLAGAELLLASELPVVPLVPPATLDVGCGVAVLDGLGTDVLGLLARAVELASLLPQFIQLSQLLPEGQPHAPDRQPVARHERASRPITTQTREHETRMACHP
jgi:hypothetical protein